MQMAHSEPRVYRERLLRWLHGGGVRRVRRCLGRLCCLQIGCEGSGAFEGDLTEPATGAAAVSSGGSVDVATVLGVLDGSSPRLHHITRGPPHLLPLELQSERMC